MKSLMTSVSSLLNEQPNNCVSSQVLVVSMVSSSHVNQNSSVLSVSSVSSVVSKNSSKKFYYFNFNTIISISYLLLAGISLIIL